MWWFESKWKCNKNGTVRRFNCSVLIITFQLTWTITFEVFKDQVYVFNLFMPTISVLVFKEYTENRLIRKIVLAFKNLKDHGPSIRFISFSRPFKAFHIYSIWIWAWPLKVNYLKVKDVPERKIFRFINLSRQQHSVAFEKSTWVSNDLEGHCQIQGQLQISEKNPMLKVWEIFYDQWFSRLFDVSWLLTPRS